MRYLFVSLFVVLFSTHCKGITFWVISKTFKVIFWYQIGQIVIT
nr:MAG TPA: hypothetical protein [Caudoviricetes sp.]